MRQDDKAQSRNTLDLVGLICAVTASAIVFYVFYPAIRETAIVCWNDDNYSHGLLLPFLSSYLLWTSRHKILSLKQAPGFSIAGVVFALLSIPPFILGATSGLIFISWLAFFLTLLSIVYLSLGTARGVILTPPILLLFLAKPIPDSLSPSLFNFFQSIAARASAWFLDLFQIPVYLSGNVLELPHMKLLVEEACSGLRSLLSLITIAIIIAYLNRASITQTLFLCFLSIVLAVSLNVLRVTSTGFLAHFISLQAATGFFHSFSGMAIFGIGLLALLWISSQMERATKK